MQGWLPQSAGEDIESKQTNKHTPKTRPLSIKTRRSRQRQMCDHKTHHRRSNRSRGQINRSQTRRDALVAALMAERECRCNGLPSGRPHLFLSCCATTCRTRLITTNTTTDNGRYMDTAIKHTHSANNKSTTQHIKFRASAYP